MVAYRGNCPRSVSSVAKYHLRRQSNRWRIQLDYLSDGDMIRSSAVGHRPLIDLIIAGLAGDCPAEGSISTNTPRYYFQGDPVDPILKSANINI